MSEQELLDKLTKIIMEGDEEGAAQVAQEALDAGIDPLTAINEGAVKGLDVLGERYARLEAFLPELMLAGDAMKACLSVFIPHIRDDSMSIMGKVVIGTVEGDIHDIGKNLVAGMLGTAGFEIYDLGSEVPVKEFVQKAEEIGATVIALSSLMTTSMYYQEEVIKHLNDAGLRDNYFVIVGGAPITTDWTKKIGADGYARNAIGAKKLVKQIINNGDNPPLSDPVTIGE